MKRHIAALIDDGQPHSTPPVTITARPTDDRIRVDLHDQGPGPDIEPHVPLDLTWGLLAPPEVMPPEVGDRLDIAFAYTLTCVAGGVLGFERDQTSWAFVFELPASHSRTAAPGLAKIGVTVAIHLVFSLILGFAAIRGAQWTPHIRNGGQESVVADRSGGVSLRRVRL